MGNGEGKMNFYNFRTDISHRDLLLKRLKDNVLSLGWGGGSENLDLRYVENFKLAYPDITSRKMNSIKKIKKFKDNDIVVVPKLPNNGKFLICVVDGDFPNCYSYVENDKTHLNHCIKVKKIYGFDNELDIHNVKVREWYAKLGWMRLPIYPLFRYSNIFSSLIDDLENNKNVVLDSSEFGDYVENLRKDIKEKIRKSLVNISPSNSNISFENVCRNIIESYGYKFEKPNHFLNGGDADLIFSISDYSNENLNNPFIKKENRLYVQIKKHQGESGTKAVEQLIKIIEEDREESAQGCAITLGTFSENAEELADENDIILINGDKLIDLFIERLL